MSVEQLVHLVTYHSSLITKKLSTKQESNVSSPSSKRHAARCDHPAAFFFLRKTGSLACRVLPVAVLAQMPR
jgi:hypothetical protein